MKSQLRKIATLAVVAALSLYAVNIAAAGEPDPCAPTRIAAQMSCPTPTPPTPVPPTPPVDSCNDVQQPFPFRTPATACVETPVVEEPAPAPAVATPAPVNYEENVSFNDTDLGVSLFKSEDANGNQQMDLYHTDTGSSTSSYLFSITQEDIAPFVAEHPAENTLLASAEGVQVYVLTTGEIQINAGPDAEGKTHVKIFDGIPWTHVYGYTIDAQ